MADEPESKTRWLEAWREKRRGRRARRRRVDAEKVTQAARSNKGDGMKWGGPMQ
jgi:hypothetical protein